jgi:hypothetical protein
MKRPAIFLFEISHCLKRSNLLELVIQYLSKLQVVHYISPHQPEDFTHDSEIEGHQWSTLTEPVPSLKGPSPLEVIRLRCSMVGLLMPK